MTGNRTFSVAAVGIPAHEQKVLRSIFTLSLRRPRSYTLSYLTADQSPDILLVDGDDQRAVGEWREICRREQAKAILPTVLVTKAGTPLEAQMYLLRRPLLAPRVLSTLDQIADKTPTAPLRHHGSTRPWWWMIVHRCASRLSWSWSSWALWRISPRAGSRRVNCSHMAPPT